MNGVAPPSELLDKTVEKVRVTIMQNPECLLDCHKPWANFFEKTINRKQCCLVLLPILAAVGAGVGWRPRLAGRRNMENVDTDIVLILIIGRDVFLVYISIREISLVALTCRSPYVYAKRNLA